MARGIELIGEPPSTVRESLPLLGRVAAGEPVSVDAFRPDWEGRASSQVLKLKDLFDAQDLLVKVRATTGVAPVGVEAGDFLVVRRRTSAKHGELVVAITENLDDEPQPLVGQLVHTDTGQVRLQTTDSKWLPIDDSRISLLGVVVASLRKY
jgi:SOS-response transcriptional repressor LexA